MSPTRSRASAWGEAAARELYLALASLAARLIGRAREPLLREPLLEHAAVVRRAQVEGAVAEREAQRRARVIDERQQRRGGERRIALLAA